MRRPLVAAGFLVALTTSAVGAETTVAGIRLGAPFLYKECERLKPMFGETRVSHVSRTDQPCVINIVTLAPTWWMVDFIIPERDKPRVMRSTNMRAFVRDGVTVGLNFSTFGLQTQAFDYQDLVEKFGPPSSRSTITLQNKLGGKFEAISANWAIDGPATVSYLATDGTLVYGNVEVDLPGASDLRAANQKNIDKLLGPGKL